MQPIGVADLDKPVKEDGPHLRLDIGVALQVERVMDVLGVLAEHFLPEFVIVGPRELGHWCARLQAGWSIFFCLLLSNCCVLLCGYVEVCR